jgi:hypothetical protein
MRITVSTLKMHSDQTQYDSDQSHDASESNSSNSYDPDSPSHRPTYVDGPNHVDDPNHVHNPNHVHKSSQNPCENLTHGEDNNANPSNNGDSDDISNPLDWEVLNLNDDGNLNITKFSMLHDHPFNMSRQAIHDVCKKKMCVICMNNVRQIRTNCGHLCLCGCCLHKLLHNESTPRCPLCHSKIDPKLVDTGPRLSHQATFVSPT